MRIVLRHPLVRWLAPVLSAVVLASAGTVITVAGSASADQPLPRRGAAQLLVDVQGARLDGLSGTVEQTADLGLPDLPGSGAGGGDSADFASLVSGTHTMRIWAAGPDRSRVALLGQYGESDLVRNGHDLWAWSSSDRTAHHVDLAAHDQAGPESTQVPLTPQQAADRALAAIDPTTSVSTGRTAVVAGRSAYQLVLEPRDGSTLVGSVRIAIDATTHVPLRVQAFATGANEPAFEVGFTSFDPTTPSGSVFDFTPPPGATVVEGLGGDKAAGAAPTSRSGAGTPSVVGAGWSSVVVGALPAGGGDPTSALGSFGGVLDSLPKVSGPWGSGHVLQGALFSAVLTDDGRVAAGAVPPAALYAALGSR